MTTDSTLTSKSQTTIPKEVRDSLHMKAGDRMPFTLMPDATAVMRVKNENKARKLINLKTSIQAAEFTENTERTAVQHVPYVSPKGEYISRHNRLFSLGDLCVHIMGHLCVLCG